MFPRPSGVVTLTTDFGTDDPYVGIMKGALLRASPKVQCVDLCHAVAPQDVATGAFVLWSAIGRFALGTVHVAVVDPGVGTGRRLLAAAAHECYWLAPDNGLLGGVLGGDGVQEVRMLDLPHLGIAPESNTFHGRDVLAPVAAWLAGGRYGFSAMGPRVADVAVGAAPLAGERRIVYVDRFGNAISNLGAAEVRGARAVRVGGVEVPLRRTYGDVAAGECLAYVGSFGLVEIGVNGGSAARGLGLAVGAGVQVVSA